MDRIGHNSLCSNLTRRPKRVNDIFTASEIDIFIVGNQMMLVKITSGDGTATLKVSPTSGNLKIFLHIYKLSRRLKAISSWSQPLLITK